MASNKLTEIFNSTAKKFKQAPPLPANFREEILTDPKRSDATFDAVLPPYYKSRSSIHWTPVETTLCIAEYLSGLSKEKILLMWHKGLSMLISWTVFILKM